MEDIMIDQPGSNRPDPLTQVPAGIGVPSDAGDSVAAAIRASVTVGTYGQYAEAQRAVDHLSDSGFPVERTAIVGTGLRLVEKVLGRMTTGRAALAGLASGAWFGLFIGLLFSIFEVTNWYTAVIAGVLIGAAWGAIFAAIAHAMTGGRRDFTSLRSLEAEQYAVVVDAEHADEARHMLVQLNWRASGAL
jgi:hypothetical protein